MRNLRGLMRTGQLSSIDEQRPQPRGPGHVEIVIGLGTDLRNENTREPEIGLTGVLSAKAL